MWEQVIRNFEQAAAANRGLPLRRGNVVHLPAEAELILAGDLHGHGPNLLRIQALAGDLAGNSRHIVLQELIHQIPDQEGQSLADGSHHVLARVVRWQLQFPGRVHVILGNHELAQMTGQDILKWGTSICKAFVEAVARHYTDEADDCLRAMYDYFASLPLAVRRGDDLAMVHSLPADRQVAGFDASVFDRPIQPGDYLRTGPAYQLVWGRTFSRPAIDCIRKALDARVLIVGHQPQPTGLAVIADDAMIIASDHAQGVVLKLGPAPAGNARQIAETNAVALAGIEVKG